MLMIRPMFFYNLKGLKDLNNINNIIIIIIIILIIVITIIIIIIIIDAKSHRHCFCADKIRNFRSPRRLGGEVGQLGALPGVPGQWIIFINNNVSLSYQYDIIIISLLYDYHIIMTSLLYQC